MTVLKNVFIFIAVIATAACIGCQPKEPEPASEIEVVFTANTWGEISPCKT